MNPPTEQSKAPGEAGTMNYHYPVEAYCPACKKIVVTEVAISYSKCAHICCVVLVMACCILGSCLLPYFSMCCVTAKHSCPECELHLGSYNPFLERLH